MSEPYMVNGGRDKGVITTTEEEIVAAFSAAGSSISLEGLHGDRREPARRTTGSTESPAWGSLLPPGLYGNSARYEGDC